MPDETSNTENKGNRVTNTLLTSTDIQAHNLIEMEQAPKLGRPPQGGRAKQQVAYPLRFRSKAQKKRIEGAAKQAHKTLRDFLIDLGEAAAHQQRNEMAS